MKYNGLTPQQHRVAKLVADGRTDQQIADALKVAAQTVRFHVWRIAIEWKLDRQGNTRAQIVAKYLRSDVA